MIFGSCLSLFHQFIQWDEPDQIIIDMDALTAFYCFAYLKPRSAGSIFVFFNSVFDQGNSYSGILLIIEKWVVVSIGATTLEML